MDGAVGWKAGQTKAPTVSQKAVEVLSRYLTKKMIYTVQQGME